MNPTSFRQLIIGAAAACHVDQALVIADLDRLEADARRWRASRAVMAQDMSCTEDEVDRIADEAIRKM